MGYRVLENKVLERQIISYKRVDSINYDFKVCTFNSSINLEWTDRTNLDMNKNVQHLT